jgi:ABC-type amino acid transport substrate-binding protein
MKKLASILAVAAVVVLVFSLTACGQSSPETQPAAGPSAVEEVEISPLEHAQLLNGKIIAAVYLKNPPEVNQATVEKSFREGLNVDFKLGGLVYVDSLTDGLLMLRSHKVDALHVMRHTGRYLAQRNSDLKQYFPQVGTYSTQMIFSLKKQAAYEKVNLSLKAMKEDGTLEKLINQWIINLPVGKEPSGGKLPLIEGAETLKVGISGDEPPLDYVAADGAPGGFNVAVLSEISRRTNININLVTVVSGARFAALQSGKIDAFLWHNTLMPVGIMTEDMSSPEKPTDPDGLFKTVSYLEDKESFFVLK